MHAFCRRSAFTTMALYYLKSISMCLCNSVTTKPLASYPQFKHHQRPKEQLLIHTRLNLLSSRGKGRSAFCAAWRQLTRASSRYVYAIQSTFVMFILLSEPEFLEHKKTKRKCLKLFPKPLVHQVALG